MTVTTILAKIKVRKGLIGDLTGGSGVVLDPGEFSLTDDSRELFIGYGSDYHPAGNLKIITALDSVDDLSPAKANYDMNGQRIINLGSPVNDKDAVNLSTLKNLLTDNSVTTYQTQAITLSQNINSPANVQIDADPAEPADTSLNSQMGRYTGFIIRYTVTRGTLGQQVGIIFINDNGTTCDMFHDFNQIGSVGIEFSVANVGGIRTLLYMTTSGPSMIMKYIIEKWA